MRRGIGIVGSAAICLGLLASAHAPAAAAGRPVAIEKELLGIRILQSYKEVLAKYGAPHRVYRANETVQTEDAINAQGEPTGGVRGFLDDSSGGGGGGRGPGGYPGSGGYPGGYPGAGGKGGALSGSMTLPAPGAGKGGGLAGGPTLPAPGSGKGGSIAGGAGLGGGLPGSGGGATDDPDATFGESGGFIWAYVFPGKELMFEFVFNKDGRVEAIIERGRFPGQGTRRGIALGDPVSKVYSAYGWTDSLKDDGSMLTLNYNDKYHTQFLTLKNKVVGIAVFLKEDQNIPFGTGGGGGGGGIAGGPGGFTGGGKGGALSGSMTLPAPGSGGSRRLPALGGVGGGK